MVFCVVPGCFVVPRGGNLYCYAHRMNSMRDNASLLGTERHSKSGGRLNQDFYRGKRNSQIDSVALDWSRLFCGVGSVSGVSSGVVVSGGGVFGGLFSDDDSGLSVSVSGDDVLLSGDDRVGVYRSFLSCVYGCAPRESFEFYNGYAGALIHLLPFPDDFIVSNHEDGFVVSDVNDNSLLFKPEFTSGGVLSTISVGVSDGGGLRDFYERCDVFFRENDLYDRFVDLWRLGFYDRDASELMLPLGWLDVD